MNNTMTTIHLRRLNVEDHRVRDDMTAGTPQAEWRAVGPGQVDHLPGASSDFS